MEHLSLTSDRRNHGMIVCLMWHLDEAAHVEEAAEVVDDLGARGEDAAHVAVDNHVQVALPCNKIKYHRYTCTYVVGWVLYCMCMYPRISSISSATFPKLKQALACMQITT